MQSSALYILCAQGKAPKADVAIFADTQDEPAYVYEARRSLVPKSVAAGRPRIDVVSAGHLSADVLGEKGQRTRFVPIPVYSEGQGRENMLRRQCTREYKLFPIERHVRHLLGYEKGQRISGRSTATALIGISRDEIQRMRPSRTPWIQNTYPLVDAGLKRLDCLRIVEAAGLPTPQKSACVYCPFHDDATWREMKANHPEEFERACAFDEAVRGMGKDASKGRLFVHRSLKPLRDVDFTDNQISLFDQMCEGMCGV